MGPLAGCKVVEFVGLGPAPFCGMLLADMGADVLVIDRKTEPAKAGVAQFAPGPASVARRGKRSVALDLHRPEAVQTALRLIARADVLIEGFRPGVMERLGLGPDECLAASPRLLYGRMTGWGQDGPLAASAGHDVNYVALSGALHCGARGAGVPWAPPSLLGDMAGGMMLAFGIACALNEVRSSGKGQVIDAAMIDAAALLMHGVYGAFAAGNWSSTPGENLLDSGAPFYEVYRCADGKWISLGALEPAFYTLLLEKLGLASDPLFADQFDKSLWPQRKRRIAEVVAAKTREEWSRLLEGTDACFAPVLDMAEAPQHAHHRARRAFLRLNGVVQPAPAPRFSRTGALVRSPPALPDEGADEALRDWGFSTADVAKLREAAVIG